MISNKISDIKFKNNNLLREFIEISKVFINSKKNNNFINLIIRNESYFQIYILLLDAFIEDRRIHESSISKILNCSKLTSQKYLTDLYENGIIDFKLDNYDKRKKNIVLTDKLKSETIKVLNVFKGRVDLKGF